MPALISRQAPQTQKFAHHSKVSVSPCGGEDQGSTPRLLVAQSHFNVGSGRDWYLFGPVAEFLPKPELWMVR
jgi:hypothetical protein